MKAPFNWLKEYVEIPMDAEEYAGRMIMTGTAVEGIDQITDDFDGVVVGKVLTCEDHPDSDHLHVCQVDAGTGEPLQIVCGAPNVAAGQLVPVALEGAHLPGGIKIKKGKLRGVESRGMICSGDELGVPDGLYPHIGDKGILVFQEDYAPGTDAKEALGLNQTVVDFEILANRPDLISIWGLARESSAVLDTHCIMPEIAVEESGEGDIADYATVRVEDDQLCPRYCARVIAHVKIGPSPMWMRSYLHAAGVRPINNIVDITNFVMLETGHPMHAFDLSKVKEQTIVVRRARDGEQLTTLDGKKHTLTGDMLVIADAERATGLAGIMGGEESEIIEGTTSVLFECAAFDRASSRLTSRALGVRTEASGRFEKGVCADTALMALERAAMLVNMLECGDVVPGVFDHYPNPVAPPQIDASVSRIEQLIAVKVGGDEMEDILGRLFMQVDCAGDELTCVPPAWRADVETEADLAEEILRLYGYDHIPSTLLQGAAVGKRSDSQRFMERVKAVLVGLGWYETMSFSFISPKLIAKLGLPQGDKRLDPVAVTNPLGEDTSVMRTSLVPSMLGNMATNLNRGSVSGRLFELAPVFEKREAGELPNEAKMISLGMYGEHADFYALRDQCVWLMQALGIKPSIKPGGDDYYHPGRKAQFIVHDTVLGQLGEVHPSVAAQFDMEGRRVYLAELDFALLMQSATPIAPTRALPKFPAVSRDLALVMEEEMPVGPLMEALEKAAGRDIERVEMFDIYRGAQLGQGKKSVAFSLTFRAADRTLTEAETAKAMARVLKAAEALGAQIRA